MVAGRVLVALAKGPLPPLLAVSAAAWCALCTGGSQFGSSGLCGDTAALVLHANQREFELLILLNPPAHVIGTWLLMLLAMTPPLLTGSMSHLWRKSLARRRWQAIAVFAAGYIAIWIPAGISLTMMAIAVNLLVGAQGTAALGISLAVAVLWQLGPVKQLCLERCHRLPRLSAFGLAADRDCLRYGLRAGLWCAGSCWALMLAALSVSRWHLLLMAMLSAFLIVERHAPGRSGWSGVVKYWFADAAVVAGSLRRRGTWGSCGTSSI